MIIFYQIRNHQHTTAACPEVTCPMCSQRGGVSIAIYQKYVWFLGPMAPGAKYGLAGCDHCNRAIPNVKWTNELEQAYRRLKAPLRTPARLWRGMLVLLALIVAMVAGGSLLLSQRSRNQQNRKGALLEYAAQPKAGDIYQVIIPGKNGGMYHTYVKYARLAGDTLFVIPMNRANPAEQQWEGLDTDAPDAFTGPEIPLSYPQFRKDLYMGVIGNPASYMTFWAMKRDGKLIKQY